MINPSRDPEAVDCRGSHAPRQLRRFAMRLDMRESERCDSVARGNKRRCLVIHVAHSRITARAAEQPLNIRLRLMRSARFGIGSTATIVAARLATASGSPRLAWQRPRMVSVKPGVRPHVDDPPGRARAPHKRVERHRVAGSRNPPQNEGAPTAGIGAASRRRTRLCHHRRTRRSVDLGARHQNIALASRAGRSPRNTPATASTKPVGNPCECSAPIAGDPDRAASQRRNGLDPLPNRGPVGQRPGSRSRTGDRLLHGGLAGTGGVVRLTCPRWQRRRDDRRWGPQDPVVSETT